LQNGFFPNNSEKIQKDQKPATFSAIDANTGLRVSSSRSFLMSVVAQDQSSAQNSSHSISIMLQKFQQGDTEIVDQLIERLYEDPEFKKLMHCAYRKLGVRGKRTEDEEGVMQEAMAQLYLKAKSKNLEGVDNRHRLFGLLRLIVAERARAHRRKGSAKKNGGDINVMSLNEPIVAGDDVDRHAQISDPESAAPQERTDMIDFVRQLLERCREKFPNEVFLGKLIEALFDGRNMNQIAEHTEGTRSQVTAAIDAIRSIAREIGGSEWKSLKVEFEM
jgi:hypothetical protein